MLQNKAFQDEGSWITQRGWFCNDDQLTALRLLHISSVWRSAEVCKHNWSNYIADSVVWELEKVTLLKIHTQTISLTCPWIKSFHWLLWAMLFIYFYFQLFRNNLHQVGIIPGTVHRFCHQQISSLKSKQWVRNWTFYCNLFRIGFNSNAESMRNWFGKSVLVHYYCFH